MTNRLWPTDRVRICVKEHCHMRNLPYSSVSREEGLAVLASLAGCSISEMEAINPIHFVRLFLNDMQEDPIELIIKLCHLFGPYTYKGLATLYSQEYRLPPIAEVSEDQTVSDSVTDVCDSDTEVNDSGADVSDCVVTDVSDAAIDMIPQDPIPMHQDPFAVPKTKAGCFSLFSC